ncbi:unnamed protein product [Rhizophagus irregularis]|nr:unnamed protein product [Rhizophagus irregularis]
MQQYKIEFDGKFNKLTNGTIKLTTGISDETYTLIPTVDEGAANFILYQSNLADIEPVPISCNIEYDGVGHTCSVSGREVTRITTSNITHNKMVKYYISKIGQKIILRQKTSATQCKLDNDDTRVIIDILNSTFSKSGGIYFVKIENNFVKDRNYREPLLGVKKMFGVLQLKIKK